MTAIAVRVAFEDFFSFEWVKATRFASSPNVLPISRHQFLYRPLVGELTIAFRAKLMTGGQVKVVPFE